MINAADESCTSTIVTISGADSASGTFTLADLSTYSSTASDIIIYTRTVDGGSFSLTGYSNNTSGRRRKLAGEEEEVQEERGELTIVGVAIYCAIVLSLSDNPLSLSLSLYAYLRESFRPLKKVLM